MHLASVKFNDNLFLASLPEEEFEHLRPHLKPVQFKANETVYNQGDLIDEVSFPLNCVLSAVAVMNDGAMVEISMVGRESVVGIVSIFGEYCARNWNRVLIPGDALMMKGELLRRLFSTRYELQPLLMSAYRSMITQVSQRAVCNGRHTVMQKLSTWLLMIHDRVGTNDLQLTQELISHRLGSRRAGITQAATALQQMQAISYKRGVIHIEDRAALEQIACECYEVQRSEFEWIKNRGAQKSDSTCLP